MATPGYKIIGPDGRETAPFDSDALMSYARRGYIQPTTSVFDPTVGQWIPASQVNALASLNGGMPSTPAPAPYTQQQSYYQQTQPQKKPFPRAAAIGIGIAVGLLVVLAAFGVGKLAAKTQPVATVDGLYSVSVPSFWFQHESKNPQIVSYISETDGMLIMRITSTSLTSPSELDNVVATMVDSNKEDFHTTSLTMPATALTVGGYPARQFEIQDDDLKVPSLYRQTIIATPDGIYDISVFAPIDTMPDDRKEQDALIASFHRTSKPAPRAPVGTRRVDL